MKTERDMLCHPCDALTSKLVETCQENNCFEKFVFFLVYRGKTWSKRITKSKAIKLITQNFFHDFARSSEKYKTAFEAGVFILNHLVVDESQLTKFPLSFWLELPKEATRKCWIKIRRFTDDEEKFFRCLNLRGKIELFKLKMIYMQIVEVSRTFEAFLHFEFFIEHFLILQFN